MENKCSENSNQTGKKFSIREKKVLLFNRVRPDIMGKPSASPKHNSNPNRFLKANILRAILSTQQNIAGEFNYRKKSSPSSYRNVFTSSKNR